MITLADELRSFSKLRVPRVAGCLNSQEAADYLGVRKWTVEQWRVRGVGPKFRWKKVGSRWMVFYSRDDLDAWRKAT